MNRLLVPNSRPPAFVVRTNNRSQECACSGMLCMPAPRHRLRIWAAVEKSLSSCRMTNSRWAATAQRKKVHTGQCPVSAGENQAMLTCLDRLPGAFGQGDVGIQLGEHGRHLLVLGRIAGGPAKLRALGLAGSDPVVSNDVGPAGTDGGFAQDAPQRR